MKPLGFTFMMLGLLALAYGGIRYEWRKPEVEVGTLTPSPTERSGVPWSPAIGVIALLAGGLLLLSEKKRTT